MSTLSEKELKEKERLARELLEAFVHSAYINHEL